MNNNDIAEENDILSALSRDTSARLAPLLERVPLGRGHSISEAVPRLEHLYFPVSGLISGLMHTPSGESAEVGLVGREGALGLMTLFCGSRVPVRAVIDTPGYAYRIRLAAFKAAMSEDAALREAMLQYAGARMGEMAAILVCNTHHSLPQRLCRAVLMRLQRLNTDTVTITHETMAKILGARRAGVTRAALALRDAGVISYSRGRLLVLDRPALEARSCECFEEMQRMGRGAEGPAASPLPVRSFFAPARPFSPPMRDRFATR